MTVACPMCAKQVDAVLHVERGTTWAELAPHAACPVDRTTHPAVLAEMFRQRLPPAPEDPP